MLITFADNSLVVKGGALLLDSETGSVIHKLQHDSWVYHGEFSADGSKILTTEYQPPSSILWDATTGEAIFRSSGHKNWLPYGRLSPDSKMVLTAPLEEAPALYDATTGRQLYIFKSDTQAEFFHPVFSMDGQKVVADSKDGQVRVWSLYKEFRSEK